SRRRGCSPCRYIYWRFRFLVASPTVRDLLLFAKHLFVAANGGSDCDVGPARAFLCSSRSPSRETPTTTMGSGTRTASPFSTLSSMRRSRSASSCSSQSFSFSVSDIGQHLYGHFIAFVVGQSALAKQLFNHPNNFVVRQLGNGRVLEQKLFRNDTGIQAREVGGLLTLHRQQSSFALCE